MGETISPEVIEKAKSEPAEFAKIFDHYYGKILNYVFRQVWDTETAEEITSSTFYRLLKALPGYKPGRNFNAWLYKIALNEVRLFYRKRGRQERLKENVLSCPPEEIYFDRPYPEDCSDPALKLEQYEQVRRMLDQLPEKYREVLVLRYWEGLKLEEIAKVLGKSVGTVKSMVHRGLNKLRIKAEKEEFAHHTQAGSIHG